MIQSICHLMMMIIFNQKFLHHIHNNIAHKNLENLKRFKKQRFTQKTKLIYKVTNNYI